MSLTSVYDLLNSTDEAQVLQGLHLLDALDDEAPLRALAANTTISRTPVLQSTWHEGQGHQQFSCCLVGAPLSPTAPYSHLAALWVLGRLLQRNADAHIDSGLLQVRLTSPSDGMWMAQLGFDLPSGELLAIQAGTPALDPQTALQQVDLTALRSPQARSRMLLAAVAQELFDSLSLYLSRTPEDLLREVLLCLAALTPPRRIRLQWPQPTLPDWLPLSGLEELDLARSAVAELPPLPAGLQFLDVRHASLSVAPRGVPGLGLTDQQWSSWWSSLRGLRRLDLSLSELPAPSSLAGLSELTELRLSWEPHAVPPSEATLASLLARLRRLPALRSLSLSVLQPTPIPLPLSSLPDLEELSLDGFVLTEAPEAPEAPPAGLQRLILPLEYIARLPPAWLPVAVPLLGRSVWLLDFGSQKINAIKQVRAVTSLGLKDAKDLVERAPCQVLIAPSHLAARRICQDFAAAGSIAVVR